MSEGVDTQNYIFEEQETQETSERQEKGSPEAGIDYLDKVSDDYSRINKILEGLNNNLFEKSGGKAKDILCNTLNESLKDLGDNIEFQTIKDSDGKEFLGLVVEKEGKSNLEELNNIIKSAEEGGVYFDKNINDKVDENEALINEEKIQEKQENTIQKETITFKGSEGDEQQDNNSSPGNKQQDGTITFNGGKDEPEYPQNNTQSTETNEEASQDTGRGNWLEKAKEEENQEQQQEQGAQEKDQEKQSNETEKQTQKTESKSENEPSNNNPESSPDSSENSPESSEKKEDIGWGSFFVSGGVERWDLPDAASIQYERTDKTTKDYSGGNLEITARNLHDVNPESGEKEDRFYEKKQITLDSGKEGYLIVGEPGGDSEKDIDTAINDFENGEEDAFKDSGVEAWIATLDEKNDSMKIKEVGDSNVHETVQGGLTERGSTPESPIYLNNPEDKEGKDKYTYEFSETNDEEEMTDYKLGIDKGELERNLINEKGELKDDGISFGKSSDKSFEELPFHTEGDESIKETLNAMFKDKNSMYFEFDGLKSQNEETWDVKTEISVEKDENRNVTSINILPLNESKEEEKGKLGLDTEEIAKENSLINRIDAYADSDKTSIELNNISGWGKFEVNLQKQDNENDWDMHVVDKDQGVEYKVTDIPGSDFNFSDKEGYNNFFPNEFFKSLVVASGIEELDLSEEQKEKIQKGEEVPFFSHTEMNKEFHSAKENLQSEKYGEDKSEEETKSEGEILKENLEKFGKKEGKESSEKGNFGGLDTEKIVDEVDEIKEMNVNEDGSKVNLKTQILNPKTDSKEEVDVNIEDQKDDNNRNVTLIGEETTESFSVKKDDFDFSTSKGYKSYFQKDQDKGISSYLENLQPKIKKDKDE